VRGGLSAEIFRAAARASALDCPRPPPARLIELSRIMELRLTQTADPRTMAAMLEGLRALHARCGARLTAAVERTLTTGAERLLARRKQRHWEPSWFSAYGGNLEATASAAVSLWRLDPRRHRDAVREGVEYLAARSEGWGAWHNERGTSAAIGALLELAASSPREPRPARLQVIVNGKVLRDVTLDPGGDPYAAAINLRALLLDGELRDGANAIEVRYDGKLSVPCRLRVQRWFATTPAASHPAARSAAAARP